jgi:hypothetical protein
MIRRALSNDTNFKTQFDAKSVREMKLFVSFFFLFRQPQMECLPFIFNNLTLISSLTSSSSAKDHLKNPISSTLSLSLSLSSRALLDVI